MTTTTGLAKPASDFPNSGESGHFDIPCCGETVVRTAAFYPGV
jgi:hypothetical protein